VTQIAKQRLAILDANGLQPAAEDYDKLKTLGYFLDASTCQRMGNQIVKDDYLILLTDWLVTI